MPSPSGWKESSLRSVGEWRSGGTPSKARADYWNGSVPWVSPKDMKVFALRDTQDHISERAVSDGARHVPAESIFIVVRGMILAHTFPVCLAERPMAFNQDVKAIVTNSSVDGRFLAHWLHGRSDALLRLVTEATHGTKRIDLRDLLAHPLTLPPLPEQRRIAEILDTVDEAIRKTEELIAKLKQVKQGLLHDLLTRGIDDNGELRDPDRHPEQFKDSPLGRIPKAWVATHAGDVVSFSGGFGFPHRFQGHTEGEIPFFKVSDQSTPGNEKFLCRASNYVSRGTAAEQGWRPAPPDAVAFAKVGAALLLNRRRLLVRESLVDNNMMTAIAGERLEPRFLYWWLTTINFATFVQPGALPSVNQGQLSSLLAALPSLGEQKQIAARLDASDLRLDTERAQLGKLELLKRGLMEDLLTGRVRVTPLLEEAAE